MIKKTLVIAILACMATVGNSLYAQKETDADRQQQLYRQAYDLYQKQKYAAAQQIFDQIASGQADRADLTTADASYFAGVCSEKLDNDDAYYRLEEFLRLYPQSSRCNMARFYLGNFYYTRADYTRALEYYRQVDAREVEYNHRSEYNFKVGYCYFQKGDYSRAEKFFSQQIGGQSKYNSSSLYYYAHIQYMNGQYDLALRNFQQLQSDRKFAKIAPTYIARIYYYLGREDELLAMAPQLLSEPDAFKKNEIHQMIGEIYFNRGEYSKALEHYQAVDEEFKRQQMQDCSPQDNNYQIGYSHYMLGHYDQAVEYLAKKTACNDSVAQNALYVLGDCYLHLDRKSDAASVFLQASKMSFSEKVKEDALFNYAKLSCELNQNAYNQSIKSFESYLKKYPRTSHKTEVQEILTELYCSTNNYKDAIRLLEKIPERNITLEQAYQRAVLNYGIEQANSGHADQSMALYEKAARINAVPRITADANYLLAECQYQQGNITAAEKSLNKFLLSSYANTSPYALDARYTYGYLLMDRHRYDEAQETFTDLDQRLQGRTDPRSLRMQPDVWNRLGDCQYVQSHFADAITTYDKVIASNGADADYATLQKALAYGAQGKNAEKLTYLNYVFERFDNSAYCSKSMLEIANTYMMCDNNEMAMTYYQNFINRYPQSVYVKTALLNQGLIYYNTDRSQQALSTFDQLLTQYPGTDESRDALTVVKNIYVAQNRVEDYFAYVQRTTKQSISSAEQDSTLFLAAEGLYQEAQYATAAATMASYLERFPNGLFSLKAHYLLADSYSRLGQPEMALPHYEAVADARQNQYTERSLLQAASIAYTTGNYQKASSLYSRLAEGAESDNSILQGRVGVMRCMAALSDHPGLMVACQALLSTPKATTEQRDEAYLAMARSCFNQQLRDSSYLFYGNLVSSANGEYSGEARCRRAEILMLDKKYSQAETLVQQIVADATSDYWLAYSFILWADIYYARGNSLQAKQTLQSIIDNYDGPELREVAQQKLDAIVAAEQPKPAPDDDEMVIEL